MLFWSFSFHENSTKRFDRSSNIFFSRKFIYVQFGLYVIIIQLSAHFFWKRSYSAIIIVRLVKFKSMILSSVIALQFDLLVGLSVQVLFGMTVNTIHCRSVYIYISLKSSCRVIKLYKPTYIYTSNYNNIFKIEANSSHISSFSNYQIT